MQHPLKNQKKFLRQTKALKKLLGTAINTKHFSQTIDFLEGSVISLEKNAFGNKTKIVFLFVIIEFLVRSLQEMQKFVVLFPCATFATFINQHYTLGDFRNISTIFIFLLAVPPYNFCNFDTKMV